MNQSTGKYAIVITSIASPNGVIKAIAKKCSADQEKKFFVIGDTKSPTDFHFSQMSTTNIGLHITSTRRCLNLSRAL
jgi:Cft2 family RNA processing exonuclease